MTLSRLVDGVGEDLKDRVLAPFQAVAAKDDPWPLAHSVRALEGGDGLIAVCFFFGFAWCHNCVLAPLLPLRQANFRVLTRRRNDFDTISV